MALRKMQPDLLVFELEEYPTIFMCQGHTTGRAIATQCPPLTQL